MAKIDKNLDIRAKRNIKDTVFSDLFKNKGNLKRLYLDLYPENPDIREESIELLTLTNILANGLRNDLGFLVGTDKIVLVEAQSTFSQNIAFRLLEYAAETLKQYVEETRKKQYETKAIKLPEVELFTIYTGTKALSAEIIELSKMHSWEHSSVNAIVKIIHLENSVGIVNQYIRFCQQIDQQRKLYGDTPKVVREAIQICKKNNVLHEYLSCREVEVVSMMNYLFSQELAVNMMLESAYDEGKNEGKIEGIDKGIDLTSRKIAMNMIESTDFSLKKIKKLIPDISMNDLRKMKNDLEQKKLIKGK
ncbi:Rpn family recombination-promoting nuclease/putative transposase [Ileibacterium valens]|uniref:Rpn family recombination-promoting nuclease/putative transposase n=1 Tax=Ileibacterium valens TaxID=1862668 RepID=UPI00272B3E54|nr:Rpn family recombination-promoting nuclease/putative transposase [Ileibacterium valens]